LDGVECVQGNCCNMKNIVSKKLMVLSVSVALISAASVVTANAALEVPASDISVAATAAPSPAPEAPASDFVGTTTPSSGYVANVVRSPVVIPEPGTMFAGFGLLTYMLFRSGRRSRA
jgi:hypothetical protein